MILVSISSTSEEVQSFVKDATTGDITQLVSISSTSEEVQSL